MSGEWGCQQCRHSSESVKIFLGHYRTHIGEPNCVFQCDISQCRQIFRGFQALKTHIIRIHLTKSKSTRNIQQSETVTNRCSVDLCGKAFDSVKDLIKHLNKHFDGKTTIRCPFSDCSGKFHKASSFRSHLTRKHRNYSKETVNSTSGIQLYVTENNEAADIVENEPDPDFDSIGENELELDERNIESDYQRYLSKYYLKVESKLLVPTSAIQEISEDIKVIIDFDNVAKKASLKDQLQKTSLDENEVESIVKSVFNNDLYGNAHLQKTGPFRSPESRRNFYKANLNYVEPEEIFLGHDATHKPCYAHYVPILKTINNLLQDRNIREQYLSPQPHKENAFKDISDGSTYLGNPLFQQFPNALRIILYQGAYEIVNPLGSAKKKHKILGVYFTLGNIYPENRAKIDSIQLALICRDNDLNHFGQSAVFTRLVYDLKQLENGIDVGLDQPVWGTIVCIVGDNLGSHSLGGFTENFSVAHFFCRYCHASRSDLKEASLKVEVQELRTPDSYKQCIDHLNQNVDESSYKGIKFDSIFNSLEYFHVCSLGLPPCIGHDLFEGVVKYDVRILLDCFTCRMVHTYSTKQNH